MGEVYEALDQELREHVALKTVRAEIADDDRAVERLKREILLARKVTHPNVCRIFDVGFHEAQGARIPFLTMELLSGETLMGRLRRAGRMQPEEALPIVRQMVAALSAAHAAGIVHRDFKSENVVLVADPSPLRAVVTDFGLARGAPAGDRFAAAVTGMGIVGSPGYMSPEQVEGGDITPAADLYALGVVIYEMMTAHLPFVGETPLQTAVKRLREDPLSPRVYAPDLDPIWEGVILRCLAREPRRRFACADDVVRALVGEEVEPPPPAPVSARATRARRLAILFGLGLGLALVVGLGLMLRARHLSAPTASGASERPGATTRRSLAVLGFKNLSGQPGVAWMSTALGEMLRSELAAGERLRTISEEDVVRMRLELGISEADSLARDTLQRIRARSGADLVVMGSYLALGEPGHARIRLDLRLQDAVLGETVASVSDTGTESDLLDLVARAGARLRGRLGLAELSPAEEISVRAALPANPEAARLYAEGLERLHVSDFVAARDRLQKSVAAEPNHPLAHAALAMAWKSLGYAGRARDEAQRAYEHSANLPREDRLLVEARFREISREWDKAIEIYRMLWTYFPDNVGYGVSLALMQASAGQGTQSLETIATLRRLPASASQDPQIDLVEARVASTLSDFRRQIAAAARAGKKGRELGARLLVAQALVLEATAHFSLGEEARALPLLDEARTIYEAAGDRAGVARVRFQTGAGLYNTHGDLARARTEFEAALAIRNQIGDQNGAASALMNLGSVLADLGDLAGARGMYEQALAAFRETDNRHDRKLLLFNLASVLGDLGDLAGARQRLEESLEMARGTGDKGGMADAQYGLSGILLSQGEVAAARKAGEEAIAIDGELELKMDAALARIATAEAVLEQGQPARAVELARAAAVEMRAQQAGPRLALADIVLARGLLGQGRLGEARAAIDRARAQTEKGDQPAFRFYARITAARVRAAEGDRAGARADLEQVVKDTATHAPVSLALDARLALAETELAAGPREAARAQLLALEKDARAKGFGLCARKAAAARK